MQAICWQPLAVPAHEQPLPTHLCLHMVLATDGSLTSVHAVQRNMVMDLQISSPVTRSTRHMHTRVCRLHFKYLSMCYKLDCLPRQCGIVYEIGQDIICILYFSCDIINMVQWSLELIEIVLLYYIECAVRVSLNSFLIATACSTIWNNKGSTHLEVPNRNIGILRINIFS